MRSLFPIKEPVNGFAIQIHWLVSIRWAGFVNGLTHLMLFLSFCGSLLSRCLWGVLGGCRWHGCWISNPVHSMKYLNENLKWTLTSAFGRFQKLNSIRLLITCGSKVIGGMIIYLKWFRSAKCGHWLLYGFVDRHI